MGMSAIAEKYYGFHALVARDRVTSGEHGAPQSVLWKKRRAATAAGGVVRGSG